jgi:hypothetical protein
MTKPHKATPDQWGQIEQFVADCGYDSCLLELRARIEALEEIENSRRFEQAKALIDQSAPTPTSSLVERVADAIVTKATSAGIVDDRPARAAIREVAAWLRDRGGYPREWIAQTLELEADR